MDEGGRDQLGVFRRFGECFCVVTFVISIFEYIITILPVSFGTSFRRRFMRGFLQGFFTGGVLRGVFYGGHLKGVE